MKNFIYIILGMVSLISTANAADKTDGLSSSIAVEKIMCDPSSIQATGNDATYKPGVDVDGNPVAAADVAAPTPTMATTYTEVPLNIDLAKKLNLSQPAEMNAAFGNLKIYQDGHVMYNGQDITQQAYVVCGKSPAEAPAPTSTTSSSMDQPQNVVTMPQPEVQMPSTTAPSATTPAK